MAEQKPRSPIRNPPTRQAGHSLQEAIAYEGNRLFYGLGFGGALFIAGILVAASSMFPPTWWQRFMLPGVLLGSGLLIGVLTYQRGRREVPGRVLGLDGERSVADSLRRLETAGYRIVHDIPPRTAGQANIDHVVLGPSGIFVIETKTYAKHSGRERISYDGNTLAVGERLRTDQPIRQVRAITSELAQRLRRQLVDEDGHQIELQPVVLFPGWFVNSIGDPYGHDVWVLSAKFLVNGLGTRRFRSDQARMLDEKTVDRIARVLEEDLVPSNR